MKRFEFLAVSVAAFSLVAASAGAQIATQVVRYSVTPVSRATIWQSPRTSPRELKGDYAVSTNEENTKLSMSLDRAVPSGYSVTANVSAPSGASSAGSVSLGTSAYDLVQGISHGTTAALSFAITVSGPSGPVMLPGRRQVIFTFTPGA